MTDLKTSLQAALRALAAFGTKPLAEAATALLNELGYKSDKRIAGAGSSPKAFLDLFGSGHAFDKSKALLDEWKSADLLFQLTDQELSRESNLFTDDSVQRGLLKSYIFIAIELKGSDYARGKFSAIARQINRLFPMPVMVFFKHQTRLTIAVINRRRNKIDDNKDVLEKATIIRDINFANPHRGHLDILESLALPKLVHPKKLPITDFDTLHAAWEQIFNVELLNERFYRELANWYFWALPQVEFPSDLEPDDEKRRATGLIRLLTRLIFCWFLKEKNLIPEKLFHPADLDKILKGFDPESETSSTYYQAILQNLFFATLNQRMGKDGKGQPYRRFVFDEGYPKNKTNHDLNNCFRYEKLFVLSPDDALAVFEDIPFLNGGLFECLDKRDEDEQKTFYLDGFSRNAKKRPHVPDRLFFDSGETADLSEIYGDKKRRSEKVTGLITILNRYKFTIVENTPIDQEIALDPELLGKVFENLLASYNEETKTTARKQTGSFYTPRPIVEYMVDESLKAHLSRVIAEKAGMKVDDAKAGLDLLFTYTEKEHPFSAKEVDTLITAIDEVKILDPACGSGAFPMGVLHKLVYILGKLDPDNDRWKQTQLAKLDSAPMREELERAFEDNNDDYGRKLYLIENCLYGVDIQPIAIQITKLRFFISLVCDQKTNRDKAKNHGIRPLPNLETKFVAADTLIGLPIPEPDLFIRSVIDPIEKEIEQAYHSHFAIQRRDQKLALQTRIKSLRLKLADAIVNGLGASKNADIIKKAHHVAEWDPFDPQSTADFFDPHWMFGRSLAEGFDVVIGNPPFIQIQNFSGQACQKRWDEQKYRTYAKTGDLYCLFYERGYNLLKEFGTLVLITSNKWMRAGYGKAMRSFLLNNGTLSRLIDFGDSSIFEAATTYTNILVWRKTSPPKTPQAPICHDLKAVYAKEATLAEMLETAGSSACLFNEDALVVISPEWTRLKQRVEELGTPLRDWKLLINYGIKTGCNEAFIISGKKRDELIAADPRSAEILKPILRGRDIKRYAVQFADLWMIDAHNGYTDTKGKRINPIDVRNNYPAVWTYLQKMNAALNGSVEARADQGVHWTNLRNCAYHEEFSKEKLIYAEIVYDSAFYYDADGFAPEATSFIMTGDRVKVLAALLNSRLLTEMFKRFYAGGDLRGNTFRYKKAFLEPLPVPQLDDAASRPFEILVDCVQHARAHAMPREAEQIEGVIDGLVYDHYFEQELRQANCYITERIRTVIQPFRQKDSDTFKNEYIQTLCEFIRNDKIVRHALVHRKNVYPVNLIVGANA